MSCKYLIPRVEGDTGPDIYTELEGVVLSSLSSLTVSIRTPSGAHYSKDAVVDDDANGLFHVVWEPGELEAGDTELEYVIVDASGYVDRMPEDAPIIIRVREAV